MQLQIQVWSSPVQARELLAANLAKARYGVQAVSKDQKDPAGMLVAASQYYQDRDARCETLLDSIRQLPSEPASPSGALSTAVEDVVSAAAWMHRVPVQRELLRAAIYGRTHAPQDVDSGLIPLCARHARVLNTLHKPSGVRVPADTF